MSLTGYSRDEPVFAACSGLSETAWLWEADDATRTRDLLHGKHSGASLLPHDAGSINPLFAAGKTALGGCVYRAPAWLRGPWFGGLTGYSRDGIAAGPAGGARQGEAWLGEARRGLAGAAWGARRGPAGRGEARHGGRGEAGRGWARPGWARRGTGLVRQGKP